MDVVLSNLDMYGSGMWVTVQVTVLSFLLALGVGVIVAAMRVSPSPPVRAAGLLYVETIRNTPPLALLVLFVYGLPKAGVTYPLLTSGVIVLGCYTGAFVAEALRSGIAAVPVGQAEAARSLGLRFGQTLWYVVLPQAFRTVIPPLGSLLSALVRNSALVAVIGVADLTYQAERLNTAETDPVPIFIGAAIAYLLLTLPLGALIGFTERRLAVTR